MENRPKRSLKDLASSGPASGGHAHARAQPKPAEQVIEVPPISRAVLDAFNPPKPPPPISIRLEALRTMDDDALMKWFTTESEFPGRALDEGTKMAITMELMRRQSKKAERPTWWRDPYFWVAAVAAVFAGVAAYPVLSPERMQPDEAASKSAPGPTESPRSTPEPEPGTPKSGAE